MNTKQLIKAVITRTEISNEGKLIIYTDVATTGYVASHEVREYIEKSKYSVIGNMYELTLSDDFIMFIKYINGTIEKIKQDKFEKSEKDNIVTLAMLLDSAHKSKSLVSIETTIISQSDSMVIMQANINNKFTSYGVASKDNVNPTNQKNLHAMAETRAIVRALKLLTNYGETVKEEKDEE